MTAMIVNECETAFKNLYSIGSSQMLIGNNTTDMTTENTIVAEEITDGGFQEFSGSLTKGYVVTLRR